MTLALIEKDIESLRARTGETRAKQGKDPIEQLRDDGGYLLRSSCFEFEEVLRLSNDPGVDARTDRLYRLLDLWVDLAHALMDLARDMEKAGYPLSGLAQLEEKLQRATQIKSARGRFPIDLRRNHATRRALTVEVVAGLDNPLPPEPQ